MSHLYHPPDFNVGRSSRRTFLGLSLVACLDAVGERLIADEKTEVLPPLRFLLEWGEHGALPGEFDACVGIALGPENEIYTSEFRNQRIQRFTAEGKFIQAFPVQPHPGGLAVDSDGAVYVAHWNSNKIAVYSAAGDIQREWGQPGAADGEFRLPGAVSLGPDGLIYVADQGNSRIQKFTRAGEFVGKWGERGKEPGQFGGDQPAGGRFAGPQFLGFDRLGNVYTTDVALDRIQKFTAEGRLLNHWGNEGSEPGGFGPPPRNKDGSVGMGGPIAICVDEQDRVWVSSTNHRVQQFSNEGQYLRGIGQEGIKPGEFETPHGIVLDGDQHLYVVDTMNSRIQKFATR